MGIPKRAHKRLYEIFQTRGKTMEDIKESGNETLYRYLCSIKKDDSELRVFGNHVMITSISKLLQVCTSNSKFQQEKKG